MEQRSYGLIIEPIVEGKDYVAGDGNLSGEVINPDADWSSFAPIHEHQAPQFETNSCATQATLNAFEALHRFMYGDEQNLSDRFVARESGTDPKRGNSPQKVAEFFRKFWSPFEQDWPMDGVNTSEEYYKPVPDLLYSKAKIVKGDEKFAYEAIPNPTNLKIKEALTKGAVSMSVAAWATDENGVYYKPHGFRDNHYVWVRRIRPDGDYEVQDSYPPYIKQVRADHIPEIAYRYTLNEAAIDTIIVSIRNLIDKVTAWLKKNQPTTNNRLRLYEAAKLSIGRDASPSDNAPDELGCAETWNEIYKNAFGAYLYQGNRNATYFLYKALRDSPKFKEVTDPMEGDTVISPTGYGKNPAMPNGHVGIVFQQGIASNDSHTGKFEINYTLGSWKSKYVEKGLYPMKFYRPV